MSSAGTTELWSLSALELLDHYRHRRLSPVEVTTAVLARIEALNPRLTAYLTVTPERALAEARAAERAYAPGGRPGLLAGVPMSLKDNVATRGIRTTNGSLVHRDDIPTDDAPLATTLFASGAVLLGKTNLPEWGWKGASCNRLGPPARNPWRLDRTTGGSSAGAASAVASGLGPLAQGGDGAGSIRIPAAFCGVFGFKPSYGVVAHPTSTVDTLAHNGPLTRTVRDGALMLNAMVSHEPRDRFSVAPGIDYLAALEGGIAGLRVAWSPDLGYAAVDPAVRALAARAAARFAELGCHVEETHPGLPDPWEIIDTIWQTAQASYYADTFAQVRDQLDPGRLPIIERGFTLSAVAYHQAQKRRLAYHEAMMAFFERYDLLLTPQLPITAFGADEDFPSVIDGHPMTYLGWTAFTYPFNLTGQPAASLPCGFVDGLPVALQVVGRWRDDVTVLKAAAAFETLQPWQATWPDLD